MAELDERIFLRHGPSVHEPPVPHCFSGESMIARVAYVSAPKIRSVIACVPFTVE